MQVYFGIILDFLIKKNTASQSATLNVTVNRKLTQKIVNLDNYLYQDFVLHFFNQISLRFVNPEKISMHRPLKFNDLDQFNFFLRNFTL